VSAGLEHRVKPSRAAASRSFGRLEEREAALPPLTDSEDLNQAGRWVTVQADRNGQRMNIVVSILIVVW
jgi:hypothetical protein